MLLKYLLLLCVLVSGDVKVFAESDLYTYEEQQCLLNGGICVESRQCPYKNRLRTQEVVCNSVSVCCDSIPPSPICRRNGGECITTDGCRSGLAVDRATDCEDGQKCCILVQ
ncbi:uncharacterized protein LOC116779641 [Danaus plexippus]|uniref:uncharacterized protein LOC116779641 n=1 Tax=Danaus plexippus TaxID=13037 RepID=UPI002AB1EBF4|nr:uncharacterized protein LOC116779641 [Danaus plexippus]